MNFKRILVVSTLPLTLSGCFFFFVNPGAFSGANGNACISSNLVVGDKIDTQKGTATVQQISGPSSRCQNATPILAQVTYN